KVDQYRLREIKKRLDSGHATAKDFEAAFNECFDDCVELCSDYIGNTVTQKFAERCSAPLKLKLVKRVAPHLAAIGVHKNGTWSVQKIIDSAKAEPELVEITRALKPYTPPLLLDQFGNYVVQCCLRLGPKFNQFIFDAMFVKCWDIAQGRFGARAMRTCLESQHTIRNQKVRMEQLRRTWEVVARTKLVAIAIVENALQLATNANGSILLTWLLDTSQLPGRYLLSAARFAKHLSTLSTHKLASLTVLKIINQRQELGARRLLLGRLFGASRASSSLLDEVLSDHAHGVGLVQKCLASQVMDDAEQVVIADRVCQALIRIRQDMVPGHTRLMEEVEAILGDPVKVANAKAADPVSVEYLYMESKQ
ncbi:MAG: armadillo-type protein, partial [Olpidium bornovanus]